MLSDLGPEIVQPLEPRVMFGKIEGLCCESCLFWRGEVTSGTFSTLGTGTLNFPLAVSTAQGKAVGVLVS